MDCWFKTNSLPLLLGTETTTCPRCKRDVNTGQVMRCKIKGRVEPSAVTQPAIEDREIAFLFGQLVSTPVGLSEGTVL